MEEQRLKRIEEERIKKQKEEEEERSRRRKKKKTRGRKKKRKMVRISVLGDALKTILNAERAGKRQVLIRPNSKIVLRFLRLMQKRNYIGDFEVVDDRRGGKVVIELLGRINKCGVISPRFDIGVEDMKKLYQTYYLPDNLDI